MGVSLVNSYNHFRRLSILALFILLLFIASASAITPTLFLGGGVRKERSGSSSSEGLERVLAQKRRAVPGSSPPTCWSKCGNCSPCLPVHVAIQPGKIRVFANEEDDPGKGYAYNCRLMEKKGVFFSFNKGEGNEKEDDRGLKPRPWLYLIHVNNGNWRDKRKSGEAGLLSV